MAHYFFKKHYHIPLRALLCPLCKWNRGEERMNLPQVWVFPERFRNVRLHRLCVLEKGQWAQPTLRHLMRVFQREWHKTTRNWPKGSFFFLLKCFPWLNGFVSLSAVWALGSFHLLLHHLGRCCGQTSELFWAVIWRHREHWYRNSYLNIILVIFLRYIISQMVTSLVGCRALHLKPCTIYHFIFN